MQGVWRVYRCRYGDVRFSMRMKIAVRWLVVLSFFFFSSARAGEWKSSASAEITTESMFWLAGTVGPDDKNFRQLGSIKATGSLKKDKFRVKFTPYFQWDPMNPSQKEKNYWDVQEGYVQYQKLPWTLQAGLNTVQWGDTDVFNPLDVVNPRRYSDPFRSEKISSPIVLVKKDFENFFIEGIYIPVQRKTVLPGTNSRWLPRDFFTSRSFSALGANGKITLPSNLRYSYSASRELNNALSNNYGLRIKFRLSGFDWTLAGFEGAATSPTINLYPVTLTFLNLSPPVLQAAPDVGLRPTFYRIRMGGTSFAWVLGPMILKGASAYTEALKWDSSLPQRTIENVLGIERSIGDFTLLLQGTYIDRGTASDDTNSVSLARMFDGAAMLGARWGVNERFTILGSYLRDTKFKGDLIHGEVSYKLQDGITSKLSGDSIAGNKETPLGSFARNDRATFSLTAQW